MKKAIFKRGKGYPQVGSYEAKTHLSRLLSRVAKGETLCITRKGFPVALFSPFPSQKKVDPQKVIDKIKSFRRGIRLNGLSLREMIKQGRRF